MSESVKQTKCYLVIFICFTVSSAQIDLEKVFGYEYNTNNGPSDDHWIWGYTNGSASNKILTSISNAGNVGFDLNDPCTPYFPSMPNFAATGRRISEIKCYEYVWLLKVRFEQSERRKICKELQESVYDPFGSKVSAIEGRVTQPGEFPHMGAIGWKAAVGTWVFKCGSSLISSKFVLTAAHCSRASTSDTSIADPVPKIVRLGDKNIIDVAANGVPPTDAKIIRIISHPKYKPPKKYYDIALMELEYDVEFSKYIQPACLWTKYNMDVLGTQATLTGWGVVESAGRNISPELQAAEVDLIDTPTCNHLLLPSCNRNWCGVHDNQLCAGKLAGGTDACQGDSGGPLQVQILLPITSEGNIHYIIGVTSFGIGCALPNLPGIYSRVSMYLDWIELIVWRR